MQTSLLNICDFVVFYCVLCAELRAAVLSVYQRSIILRNAGVASGEVRVSQREKAAAPLNKTPSRTTFLLKSEQAGQASVPVSGGSVNRFLRA